MTLEESRKIVADCDGYIDSDDFKRVVLDGTFTVEQLRALIMVLEAGEQPA